MLNGGGNVLKDLKVSRVSRDVIGDAAFFLLAEFKHDVPRTSFYLFNERQDTRITPENKFYSEWNISILWFVCQ